MSIDAKRLDKQLRADAQVLQVLAEQGDVCSIVRPIDVHFFVDLRTAKTLEREIEKIGWLVLQTVVTDNGMLAIDA